MLKQKYLYEADWSDYAFPDDYSHLASSEELAETFGITSMKHPKEGGIPLLVDGDQVVLNGDTENTIIYGQTGSKKTRCVVEPLIVSLANAHESMFVVDVKGELSSNSKLQGILQQKDYRTVYLDFRNFRADGYNLLEYPFQLYCSGQRDKAVGLLARFINGLYAMYEGTKADPFWQVMSFNHLMPLTQLMFEVCSEKEEYYPYVNMLTLAAFTNQNSTEELEEICNAYLSDVHTNASSMLKSVLSAPERTKASIVATTASVLKDFIFQESLLKMLSRSTFSVEEMYRHPTCVYLIVPDETSAYDSIVGLMEDNFYQQLIVEFNKRFLNREDPPCRINWVCDEFCNLRINDMRAKISASRSRFMRWTLVCQSKSQLESIYPDDASTILGNCQNVLFLQSADMDLLEYISNLCGHTSISESGGKEPLLPVDRLKRLEKAWEYKEAVYFRNGLVYLAKLPDIDCYQFLDRYASNQPARIPGGKLYDVEPYTPEQLHQDLRWNRVSVPFTKTYNEEEEARKREYLLELQQKKEELEEKVSTLSKLFGIMADEDEEEEEARQQELDEKFNRLFGVNDALDALDAAAAKRKREEKEEEARRELQARFDDLFGDPDDDFDTSDLLDSFSLFDDDDDEDDDW